jgi:hypothetical protein
MNHPGMRSKSRMRRLNKSQSSNKNAGGQYLVRAAEDSTVPEIYPFVITYLMRRSTQMNWVVISEVPDRHKLLTG